MVLLDYFFSFSPGGESSKWADFLIQFAASLIGVLGALGIFWLTTRNEIKKERREKKNFENDKLVYLDHLLKKTKEFAWSITNQWQKVVDSFNDMPTNIQGIATSHNRIDIKRLVKLNQEEYFHAYQNRIGDLKVVAVFDAVHYIYECFNTVMRDFQEFRLLDHKRRMDIMKMYE